MGTSAIVVGGGLAGIAAALRLADAGATVQLVEGRPRLGGAAFSFRRGDLSVDNGQHVFLRCCEAYRELVRPPRRRGERRTAAQAVHSHPGAGRPQYEAVPATGRASAAAPLGGARRIPPAVGNRTGAGGCGRAGVAPARSGQRGARRADAGRLSSGSRADRCDHRRAVGCRRYGDAEPGPGRGVTCPCGEGVPHRPARPRAGVRRRVRRHAARRAALGRRGSGAGRCRRRGAARPPSGTGRARRCRDERRRPKSRRFPPARGRRGCSRRTALRGISGGTGSRRDAGGRRGGPRLQRDRQRACHLRPSRHRLAVRRRGSLAGAMVLRPHGYVRAHAGAVPGGHRLGGRRDRRRTQPVVAGAIRRRSGRPAAGRDPRERRRRVRDAGTARDVSSGGRQRVPAPSGEHRHRRAVACRRLDRHRMAGHDGKRGTQRGGGC